MSLSRPRHSALQRCLLLFLILVVLLGALRPAAALPPLTTPPPSSQPGVVWQICKPPGICFATKAERDKHAADNHCRFLEDVCEPAAADNQGAKPEDQGFWGSLWNGIKGGLTYGYNFVRGVFEGMKGQITDLIDLISNAGDVISGLVDLGKAFYNDPKGTIAKLGQLLGQEAVDTLTKATQCGAYDLGKVIGSYVSPAVALKLATKLTKYAGKLDDAVRAVKHDLGCASFAAGTLVQTPDGPLPIERITVGQRVDARNEANFHDQPRPVEKVFGRVADSYRLLHTDLGTLTLTDEHPLWVQGKGWTEASAIAVDDVVAAQRGDALVRANEAVRQPLRVYNFSVATTHNYFVGADGIWAHNAKCSLPMPYKAPKSPTNYQLGATDGGPGQWKFINRGNSNPNAYNFEKQVTGAPKNVEYNVNGVNFDGYDSKTGALLDAKNYSETNLLFNPRADMRQIAKDNALSDARKQLAAAGGAPVEWHVSNPAAVTELTNLFNANGINVKVVFTADIVN